MITIPALRPTLREKTRYLSYRVFAERPLSARVVEEGLRQHMFSVLGLFDHARAHPDFLRTEMQGQEGFGLLKIERDFVDHARTALLLTRSIQATPVMLHSTGVSGIIDHLSLPSQKEVRIHASR